MFFKDNRIKQLKIKLEVKKHEVVLLIQEADKYKNSYYTDRYIIASCEVARLEEELACLEWFLIWTKEIEYEYTYLRPRL